MRTPRLQDSDSSVRVAERHKIFAEDPDRYGSAVGLRDLPIEYQGDPISSQHVSHWRAGADFSYELVFSWR